MCLDISNYKNNFLAFIATLDIAVISIITMIEWFLYKYIPYSFLCTFQKKWTVFFSGISLSTYLPS